jgi:hypothetical protein
MLKENTAEFKLNCKTEAAFELQVCLTATTACRDLAAVPINVWHYVVLKFSSTTIASLTFNPLLLTGAVTDTLPAILPAATTFDLYLGLTSATFKEVKLYSYTRTLFEKCLAYSQVDSNNKYLKFYYPLDGKKSVYYFYNHMAAEE